MLLPVLIINTIIFVGAFNLPDNQTLIESKASDFIFETPDVTKEYVREVRRQNSILGCSHS